MTEWHPPRWSSGCHKELYLELADAGTENLLLGSAVEGLHRTLCSEAQSIPFLSPTTGS